MTVIDNQSDVSVGGEGDEGSGPVAQKSAMALVNDLTRFHGVKHEYRLSGESGPPHEKTFHVDLHLGEKEVFRGSGRSIRKAQHAAAQSALSGTTLAHPSPKARKSPWKKSASTTPTVELNVLAMRRGLEVKYKVEDPQNIIPVPHFDVALLYDYRQNPHQRHHFKKTPYSALLTVGDMVFEGKGMTPQGARHTAADKALRVLRDSPADPLGQTSNESKSPVSLVHEIAAKMNETVQFDLVTESGPTHMPSFVIRCVVGENSCLGQGNSKKQAKKKAAQAMVQKLQQENNEPLEAANASDASGDHVCHEKREMHEPQTESREENDQESTEEKHVTYQSVRELISPSTSISEDDKDHPVHPVNQLSNLVRIQRKEEPRYLLIYERCIDRKRKEFVVECSVRDPGVAVLTAVGIDAVRKTAKKKAAEAMMQLILTGRSSPEICLPPKPSHPPILKDSQTRPADGGMRRERRVSFTDKSGDKIKKRTMVEKSVVKMKSKASRNIAPGVLLLQKTGNHSLPDATSEKGASLAHDLSL